MRSRILILVSLIVILAGACRREEPPEQESWMDPAASSTTTMPEPPGGAETEAGTTLVVTLNDGHLATRESAIPVGSAVITVMNAGQEVHGLHIEGPGVQKALEATLGANESGTIAATFQQGTYEFYCPVLDHRKAGETLTVTIPTP